VQRLRGGGAFRRDGPAQHLHRREVLHREGSGVQQLHRGEHAEWWREGGDTPAHHRRGGGACGESGRAEPLDQLPAPGEQGDLGDDRLGHQQADHRVGHALRAPVDRREAVIGGMRALDQRAGQDDEAEGAVGEQAEAGEGVRRGLLAGGLRQERRGDGGRAVAGGEQPRHQPGAGDGEQPAGAGARRHVGDGADGTDRPVLHAPLPRE